VLLNLDAGEHANESDELWRLFDILAIACGGHAGDAASMSRVLAACAKHAIRAGAHPSYPDREGFGRRPITIGRVALAASIEAQCAALREAGRAHGIAVEYVKPHGALYHDVARDPALADAVLCGAVDALGAPTVIGPPRGALRDATIVRGLRYLREGFADRNTHADGSLIPRGEPGALITDPAAAVARAQALVDVDTICVHADTPNALAIARAVREATRD
jgi:UPF0271 protein